MLSFVNMPYAILLSVALLSCTDYSLTKDPPAPKPPSLQLSEESIDLGVSCPQSQAELILSNVGDDPLSLEQLFVSGEGWRLATPFEAFDLGAGESHALTLETDGGDATLTILSNASDHPDRTVPLSAIVNQAPSFDWENLPDVIGLEPVDMRAAVEDDGDRPEHLLIQWRSDQDGVFGVEAPNAEGDILAVWRPYHTPGDHMIQLMVTDSCMSSTSELRAICQQGGFDNSMLTANDVALTGSASCASDWSCELGMGSDSSGSVFFEDNSLRSDLLAISFEAELTDGFGFALSLRPDSESVRLGQAGPCLGVGAHIDCLGDDLPLPGLAIVFLTEPGLGLDSQAALIQDGDFYNPIAVSSTSNFMGRHRYQVEFDGASMSLSVDETTIMTSNLPLLSQAVFLGFTAAGNTPDSKLQIEDVSVLERVCSN